LGRTNVIFDIPWLVAYNLEIYWKKEEFKMTRCPPLYEKNKKIQKKRKRGKLERQKRKKTIEKIVLRKF